MLDLPGYAVLEILYEAGDTVVARATRAGEVTPIIIKTSRTDVPMPGTLARLRHEHAVLSSVQVPHVVRALGLQRRRSRLVLELEDFRAEPLSNVLSRRRLTTREVLDIGLDVCEALGALHRKGIVHKDVKPRNVLVDLRSSTVKLADLGLASRLDQETPPLVGAGRLEGTLAYMSPEQTGRMNRGVDYRTDFYSFGVMLYEMLTGRRPFRGKDHLALVHEHMAVEPPAPREVDPAIPSVLSSIVVRLMSKMAEDRYQSAFGLQRDLARCRSALAPDGTIAAFPLGEDDGTDRFQLPQRLYGRDPQLATLATAFGRIRMGACELMLVTGDAGIGKTALVRELHKPLARDRGLLLSGKFDQLARAEPLSAFISAFRDLVRQTLAEDDDAIAAWRDRLTEALGVNAQIMVDVIPELDHILGPQEPVPELPANEAHTRFEMTFQAFVGACVGPDRPVALFLDDLHWADSASLALIEALTTTRRLPHLFIVGAYRDNEVDANHPLTRRLAAIRADGATVREIHLGPLARTDVASLVTDTVRGSAERARPLARLVAEKTRGNPFFINQLLVSMHDDGMLEFDTSAGHWTWEPDALEGIDYTDNVIELMVARLGRLPDDTRELLTLAACVGSTFEHGRLSIVSERSHAEVAQLLWPALQAGLAVPLGHAYSFFQDDSYEEETEGDLRMTYRFRHDNVQAAAYSLIPEGQRPALHLRTGRLMLARIEHPDESDSLFDVVGHLNQGVELMDDPAERLVLAVLDLVAGRRAADATAFTSAAQLLQAGMRALPEDAWNTDYETSYGLYLEGSRCTYLSGDFEAAEPLFEELLTRVRTVRERANVQAIQVELTLNRGNVPEALELVLDGIGLFGLTLSREPSDEDLGAVLAEVSRLQGDRPTAALIDLPAMEDPDQLALMKLLFLAFPAAYESGLVNLSALVAFQLVRTSLEHGNSPYGAFGYATAGMIVGSALADYASGYAWAQLGVDLAVRQRATAIACSNHFAMGTFVIPWTRHLEETIDVLEVSTREGLETGNVLYVAWALMAMNMNMSHMGRPLDEVLEQADRGYSFCTGARYPDVARYFVVVRQSVRALQGYTEHPTSLSDAGFEEGALRAEFDATPYPTPTHVFHIRKAQLGYLFGDLDLAWKSLQASEGMLHLSFALYHCAVHTFLHGMTLAARLPDLPESERPAAREAIEADRAQLATWASFGSGNFLHKERLVAAELARLDGDTDRALALYNEAIESASEHGFTQDEALATELAGRLHLAAGRRREAVGYMLDARNAWLRWGAVARARHLEDAHADVLAPIASAAGLGATLTVTRSHSTTRGLDLTTVLKATQAITREIELDGLLDSLTRLAMENAGGERAVLVLAVDDELSVEAVATMRTDEVFARRSVPVHASHDIPRSVVRYVARVREALVLDDAQHDRRFKDDPYIQDRGTRSVLCLPLIKQAALVGLVYVENDLASGAFTPARLELLSLISAQVAIALENARLYSRMKALNVAYKRFVPAEFLEYLGRDSVLDVRIGDQVEHEMTVMFCDIRSFTSLSDAMTPEETFQFISSYLERVSPVIARHGGFIDKYIGDAIMALFRDPDAAVDAVAGMRKELAGLNAERAAAGQLPIRIGAGLHAGTLRLGTVGHAERMETTVISDAVNVASRIEGATKRHGIGTIVSAELLSRVADRGRLQHRYLGEEVLRGKAEPIALYEIFQSDPEDLQGHKRQTRTEFERCVRLFHAGELDAAAAGFEAIAAAHVDDVPARYYVERCRAGADTRS